MNDIWEKYAGDFNSLTDKEIEETVSEDQAKISEMESWLEAVASWKAAGKPRTLVEETNQ